ncbi:MAG TPA: carboxypeptidase-like regulatory domain-containing protein [Chitinophagaceae bacterium]|nr:carboxypeptidase-like regulatory domain-containing protein [Chitinophagaceae bacterium]
MGRHLPLLFILVFCSELVFPQVSISGKVLNDANGSPLEGASVYINNSTLGSTTNADGSYRLSGVMPGTYDIIVSFVSFEPIVHRVSIENKDLKFTFRMNEKATQMRDILVMSDELRKKRLKTLRDLFLGVTLAGERSRILNEDDIFFEGGNKKGEIIAFSEQPLIVINKELGYKIYFELKKFYLDEVQGRSYFFGFTRYEDLEKGNRKKWEKRRLQYYQGSTMHFYHCLSDGNTKENDFRIFRIREVDGAEIRTISEVAGDSIVKQDSVRQMKYIDVDGSILVKYLNDPYYKSHLKTKVMLSNGAARGIQSTLTILEYPCYLDRSGLLENPLSVQYSGFWSYEKLANMLPVDYNPPNRKPEFNPLRTKP